MRAIVRGRRPSPALVISVIALVVSLTGTGIAQDAVTAVLNKQEKKQTRNIAKKEINKQAIGLTVGNAAKLAGREIMFARVNADGGLRYSSGGFSTTTLGTGIYQVDFPKALAKCPVVATPQNAQELLLDEAMGSPDDKRVGVFTSGSNGTFQNSRFDVIAYC